MLFYKIYLIRDFEFGRRYLKQCKYILGMPLSPRTSNFRFFFSFKVLKDPKEVNLSKENKIKAVFVAIIIYIAKKNNQ